MGKELFVGYRDARDVYEEVNEALQFSLTKLMFEGPKDDLTMTANTQPALLAHSVALFRVIKAKCPELLQNVKHVLGHSIGEYPALVVAGSLGLADAAVLVHARGKMMQSASDAASGGKDLTLGMSALLLTPTTPKINSVFEAVEHAVTLRQQIAALCTAESQTSGTVAGLAAVNSLQQAVLSGHQAAIDRVSDRLRGLGVVKRSVGLTVSAPFHTQLMRPAADTVARILDQIQTHPPIYALVANASACELTDVEDIKAALVNGITSPVLWAESILRLLQAPQAATGTHFMELGPAGVVAALSKQCDVAQLATHNSMCNARDVDALLRAMERSLGSSGTATLPTSDVTLP